MCLGAIISMLESISEAKDRKPKHAFENMQAVPEHVSSQSAHYVLLHSAVPTVCFDVQDI